MVAPNPNYENKSKSDLVKIIEAQKNVINGLENEVKWNHGLIMNRSLNELKKRIIAVTTPREMKMGLATEAKEQKIYYPKLAEEVKAEEKQVSKCVRSMKKEGFYKYDKRTDEKTGNTRVFITPLEPLSDPGTIDIYRPQHGGSVWRNGVRIRLCKECGSENLESVKEVFCRDCGCSQGEKIRRDVNPPNEGCQLDTPVEYALEADCSEIDEIEPGEPVLGEPVLGEPVLGENTVENEGCQLDTPAKDALEAKSQNVSKVPCTTYPQVGVYMELLKTIPQELLKRRQWVVWRYETPEDGSKKKKVPYQAKGRVLKADTTDASTWCSYEEAVKLYRESLEQRWNKPLDGIGFVLADGVVGVDIDHCISENGNLSDLAADVINTVASYSELSPSETGVHIIALGKLPDGWRKHGNLEMYENGRYLTFTGQHILGTPEQLEERTEQLATVHAKYAPTEQIARPIENTCGHESSTLTLISTDEILMRARNAANGAKFKRLYDDGDITGYPSPSNADLALCNILAYYTDNTDTIDKLFRESALMRPKWDENARTGETYGEGTIRKALEGRQDMARGA